MRFCDTCDKETQVEEQIQSQIYNLHGKEFPVELTLLICNECGSEVYNEAYSTKQMNKIHETYDRLFGGMSIEEIKAVRAQYKGLGTRPFSKIIGIGSASLTRHESGDTPSEKYMNIYRELKENPSSIWKYFEQNKHELSPRELKKTEEILTNWEHGRTGIAIQDDEEIIEAIHKPYEFSVMNGNLPFNLEKLIQMILYFTRIGINKTKLMKLLWYSDFVQYKRQSVSMSGTTYIRLPFGPVPKDHEIMLAHLKHMDVITIEETILNDEGWVMMSVKAKQDFLPDLFNEHELSILEEVESKFREFGSRKISQYSHEERAWIETESEQIISYKFAEHLKGFPIS